MISDADRVILPDYLSEVPGGREMVVQPTIRDQEYLPSRNLAVDHPAHIDAGLAHEISPELDREPRMRQRVFRPLDDNAKIVSDLGKIEGPFAGK